MSIFSTSSASALYNQIQDLRSGLVQDPKRLLHNRHLQNLELLDFEVGEPEFITKNYKSRLSQLKEENEQGAVVQYELLVTHELVTAVLGFGADAKVLSKGELMDRVTGQVSKMQKAYKD